MKGKYGVAYSSSVTQEFTKTVDKGCKAELESGFDVTKISPWLQSHGVTLGVTGTTSIAVASKQTTEQVNSQTLTYTLTPTLSIPAGQEARPKIQVLAHRKKFKVWTFGTSGFVGEKILTVDTYDETPFRPMWEIRAISSSGGGSEP